MKLELMATAIIIVTFFSFVPERIFAECPDAIEMEEMLIKRSSNELAEVDVEMTVEIPCFESIGPIVLTKYSIIPYTKSENSLIVQGKNIPLLKAEIRDAPDVIKPVTIVISGIKGNKTKISRKKGGGEFEIKNLGFQVRLYRKRYYEVNPSTKPDLEFIISEINAIVSGFDEDGSYLEIEYNTELPKIGNRLFDQHAAGKTVKGVISLDILKSS